MRYTLGILMAMLVLSSAASAQNRRETAVRDDKKLIETDESWIYNDLQQAATIARTEKKPLLVLIRCVP